ncbi:MAG: hypothetical protein HXX14_13640 [Bacteroidetes bacterium]|nr:hypothetical protein [Bacteroidota bacterium]
MNNQRLLKLFFIPFIALIVGCHQTDQPKFKADTSKIDLQPIKIKRYDKAFFAVNPSHFKEGLIAIAPSYPLFLKINLNDTSIINDLKRFAVDTSIRKLSNDVQKKYSNISPIENQLTDAFKRTAFFFKGYTAPQIYTYISGLDYLYPIRYDGDNMAISIDLYLGKDYLQYKKVQLPNYKIRNMTPERLLPDCMTEVAKLILSDIKPGNTLLDKMIYEGKVLLFLDAVIPETPDSIKIGYTSNQLTWCNKNASNIWKYFIENKLLYASNPELTKKFIQDSPFTTSFGRESAPRFGAWTGWQIIREFMNKNSSVSIEQLFKMTDSQTILEKSGYKPEE